MWQENVHTETSDAEGIRNSLFENSFQLDKYLP